LAPEYEGMMLKKGQINTALKRRFFRLRNGILYYYKDQKTGNAATADICHIGSLECKEMKLETELAPLKYKGETLFGFTVLARSVDSKSAKWRILECFCESEAERAKWMQRITEAIAAEARAVAAAAAAAAAAGLNASTHANVSKGRKQSVILEARGQPASNIYSQYADPVNPETWHHYELHAASLVISCGQDTTRSDCALARDLAHHHVPFICVCDSDIEAKVLYEAGVTYVVQQEALAAKVLGSFFLDEDPADTLFFEGKALEHIADIEDELCEDESNRSRRLIAPFL